MRSHKTLLVALLLAGCSGGSIGTMEGDAGWTDATTTGGGDLAAVLRDLAAPAMPDLATPPADLTPGPYPAGPYGAKVGDTIAPLAWEGYLSPAADALATTKPYGAYAMNDVRLSGRRYALVHISEFF